LTADGIPIVLHDASVDRTTDGSGAVGRMTIEEVRRLDAGIHKGAAFKGTQIPTLGEALDSLKGRAKVVVELKGEGDAFIRAAARAVVSRDLVAEVTFSAFAHENLKAVAAVVPGASLNPLGGMKGRSVEQVVDDTLALGAGTLGMVAADATSELAQAAHDAGLILRCSGAADDTGPEIRRLISIGADGLTTNCPDVLMGILREDDITPW